MKKFSFRLKTVLEYRTHLAEIAENELHQLTRRQMDLKEAIEKNRLHGQTLRAELSSQTELTRQDLELYNNYHYRLTQDSSRLEKLLAQVEQELDEKRKNLLQARNRKKDLENLQEKQQQQHRLESERQLQREYDEMYLLKQTNRSRS